MLVKVCNQIVHPLPLIKTAGVHERRIIPVNSREFRYLRFKAIGCMEWPTAGPNGNHDGFPFEHFEDDEPGYGYRSFVNKRAHCEHNCLVPGSLILMADMSYKFVENVQVGDQVVTHDGVGTVSKVFVNPHTGYIHRVKVAGLLQPLAATGLHPLWSVLRTEYDAAFYEKRRVYTKYYNAGSPEYTYEESREALIEALPCPAFRPAQDLRVRDYLVFSTYAVEENVNSTIADPRWARLLGYYLAEGSTIGNRNMRGDKLYQGIQFSFNRQERDLIDDVHAIARELKLGNTTDHEITSSRSGQQNCVVVNLYSTATTHICMEHCSRLARSKKLSYSIFQMPAEWKQEFLKAYIAGDGHREPRGNLIISTASKHLALQLQMLIASLGGFLNLSTRYQRTPNDSLIVPNSYGNPIYVGTLSLTQQEIVFGVEISTSKRANISIETEAGRLSPIRSIEVDDYEGVTYNFEVSSQNSYVTGNVIVHNSSEGLAGSIGDLPDAFLNTFIYSQLPSGLIIKKWAELAGKDRAPVRLSLLSLPNQRDGSIEVMMRIDTQLVKSATLNKKTRYLLERIIRMIDTGQQLTCSMGANIAYSVCSTCGNLARFSNEYCEHVKGARKGAITIVPANQLRDLLDKDLLRPEWLKHTVASKFDIDQVLGGTTNKGVAARNIELNHKVSFFELSVVAMPAFGDAVQLEKLARQQDESRDDYFKRLVGVMGDDEVLDLYALCQERGLISTSCEVQ